MRVRTIRLEGASPLGPTMRMGAHPSVRVPRSCVSGCVQSEAHCPFTLGSSARVVLRQFVRPVGSRTARDLGALPPRWMQDFPARPDDSMPCEGSSRRGRGRSGCVQVRQCFADQANSLVHIRVGRLESETESNGRLSVLRAQPNRTQDMRGLGDARRASRPCGCSESRLERLQDVLRPRIPGSRCWRCPDAGLRSSLR